MTDEAKYEFDPRSFFASSDVDSNGVLDRNEITALLLKYLNELSQHGGAEDLVREVADKIEQTVETLMQQLDKDGDGYVTYNEFLDRAAQSGLLKTRPEPAPDQS
ncbi:EF-hand domain-containing protein [Saccharopolyspora sp. K220]|uniref:EF-hand domain-containing protein n=1 Tax=Saccharopolyspora soli TaxID=2926618 RepID=UPI001F564ACA|nr:EF-hand domain-containing protein [Saccharopolyspora soli]MCI2418436.1 EF-hand domain-containing protein [Saccharopolyspora soli]